MEDGRVLAGYRESDSEVLLSRALTLLSPTCESLCIDVGCGELHVLDYVARRVSCRCVGIESDSSLVEVCNKKIAKMKQSNIVVIEADVETCDLSTVSKQAEQDVVIYMFLSQFGYSIMGRQILQQMPNGTRVVTVSNPIGSYWSPVCVWEGDQNQLALYLYIVTDSAKEAAAASEPTLSESKWKHPPPGSYCPREIPSEALRIPSNASHETARELCLRHDSFRLHMAMRHQYANDHREVPTRTAMDSGGGCALPGVDPCGENSGVHDIRVAVARIPLPPPLPPLPSLSLGS